MQKILWSVVSVVFVLFLFSCGGKNGANVEEEQDTIPLSKVKYGFPIDEYRVVTDTVQNGETLSDILSRYNVSSGEIHHLAEKAEDVFSVRNIRPNRQYSLLFCSEDSTAQPHYFIYEHNLAKYVVFDLLDSLDVAVEEKTKETRTEVFGNTITSSLWNAFIDKGKSPGLTMEMADVYQWTIDFYNIKAGDSFKVLYSQDYVEGKPLGTGKVLASAFTHQDSTYYAFDFQDGDVKGYFDENGGSAKKAFLKAPLKFSRISSGFSSARFHPVLKYTRAHKGVDYAAPTGTPVWSVANGTVIKKAYQRGGAGKYVKIKHNKTYTTVYMHFSRFAKGLQVGQHVCQGDIIGYVGMTGTATGPHCHYGVIKNGKHINPLSMKIPPSKPLEGEVLEKFKLKRDSLVNLLGVQIPEKKVQKEEKTAEKN